MTNDAEHPIYLLIEVKTVNECRRARAVQEGLRHCASWTLQVALIQAV